ncbi:MAG TPA: Flp pilus assembly protein CpaB [Hyphomicrobiaceae bacterium]|jgi:pilus assembly protein CpaB|nr:Flp pilus assembly protein CpaB [Hyphomicrobiaceae bacterium]
MKRAQLLGVTIAAVCGLGAFFGVMSLVRKPAKVVTQEVQTNTTQVLVAKSDIALGQTTAPENFRWQDWPQSAVGKGYIQRSARPNAAKDLAGSVARAPMLPGEPVTAQKLVKPGDGGVLAAILPTGMRAISTRIKEETAAGRLILPNDHVDVLLTQRKRGRSGGEDFSTETLFHNVRVLAIGQLIEAREGKRLAEGNTATLELTPRQAEILAEANSRGEISLALRSIADINEGEVRSERDKRVNSIKVLRYGVSSRAYGVD